VCVIVCVCVRQLVILERNTLPIDTYFALVA
jgi:hypothetical protein